MDKVAVLIPCYNESKTIAKVVADFQAVLPEGSVIYVYDNNSTDGTAEIAAAAGAVPGAAVAALGLIAFAEGIKLPCYGEHEVAREAVVHRVVDVVVAVLAHDALALL